MAHPLRATGTGSRCASPRWLGCLVARCPDCPNRNPRCLHMTLRGTERDHRLVWLRTLVAWHRRVVAEIEAEIAALEAEA